MISLLKLVSDETRLNILFVLNKADYCVFDIEKKVGKSQSLVSKHLKILRDSGVVEVHKEGKNRCYLLKDKKLKELLNFLKENYA